MEEQKSDDTFAGKRRWVGKPDAECLAVLEVVLAGPAPAGDSQRCPLGRGGSGDATVGDAFQRRC